MEGLWQMTTDTVLTRKFVDLQMPALHPAMLPQCYCHRHAVPELQEPVGLGGTGAGLGQDRSMLDGTGCLVRRLVISALPEQSSQATS